MQMESFVAVVVIVTVTVITITVAATSDVDDDFLDLESALFHLGRLQEEEKAGELIW